MSNDVVFRRINGRIVPIRARAGDREEREARKSSNQAATLAWNAGRGGASGATVAAGTFAVASRWESVLRDSIKKETKDLSSLVRRLNKMESRKPPRPEKKPRRFSEAINELPKNGAQPPPIFDEKNVKKTRPRKPIHNPMQPDLDSLVQKKIKTHSTRTWTHRLSSDQIRANKEAIKAARDNINFLRKRMNFITANKGKYAIIGGAVAGLGMFGQLAYTQFTEKK